MDKIEFLDTMLSYKIINKACRAKANKEKEKNSLQRRLTIEREEMINTLGYHGDNTLDSRFK